MNSAELAVIPLTALDESASAPRYADISKDESRQVVVAPGTTNVYDGLTWKMLDPIPVTCVMPLTTLVVLKSGELLGLYNDRWPELQQRLTAERGRQTWWNRVFQIRSRDGGLTWSAPEKVAESETMNLCEPFVLRSDDGQELCCILRNNGGDRAQLSFSRDEGRTWSAPEPSSAALTGHRHHGVRDSKGRWTIAFRDVDRNSPYRNHFCCWRGTYDDIVKRNDREKIKLLHSRAGWDCGYAACVLLPGDEVMAFTYIKYRKGPEKHSIVGVRIPDQLP